MKCPNCSMPFPEGIIKQLYMCPFCLADLKGRRASRISAQGRCTVGSFTDSRDGNVYKTVKIGNQVWLAENFRFNNTDSYGYENNPENDKIYGRLYTWKAAMSCAPDGWHLPEKEEWDELFGFADKHARSLTGVALKSKEMNGSDEFGFCAISAGCRNQHEFFYGNQDNAFFWCATKWGFTSPYAVNLYKHYVHHSIEGLSMHYAFSVRLVKD